MDYDLFTYPRAPGFKEGTTSRDAAEAMKPKSENIREECLGAFRWAGDTGLTPDQVAAKIGRSVLAVRPRITELAKLGKIEKTKDRRRNDSGMNAGVWRLKKCQ